MNKGQVLKLIDECPYWGEDAESEVMIKSLKKWFEFKLDEIDGLGGAENSIDIVTKREFKFEINRLWNEIRQITSKLIVNKDSVPYPYPGTTPVNIPYTTYT